MRELLHYMGLGEWKYFGCIIQRQDHPKLLKYHVFTDDENQTTVGTCSRFSEAKEMCKRNSEKNQSSKKL